MTGIIFLFYIALGGSIVLLILVRRRVFPSSSPSTVPYKPITIPGSRPLRPTKGLSRRLIPTPEEEVARQEWLLELNTTNRYIYPDPLDGLTEEEYAALHAFPREPFEVILREGGFEDEFPTKKPPPFRKRSSNKKPTST